MTVSCQQAALFAELRLAGASTFEAVDVLLAAQSADQAVELSKVWQRELRDTHGKFASRGHVTGNGTFGAPPRQKRAHRLAAMRAAGRALPADAPDELRTATVGMVKKGDTTTQQKAHEDVRQHVADLMDQVEKKHQEFVKEQDTVQGKKSRLKASAMIGSLIAGGVLGYIESKMGLPDAAQIASTLTPAVAESLFEWKKRL
jgi:hypothetical protein